MIPFRYIGRVEIYFIPWPCLRLINLDSPPFEWHEFDKEHPSLLIPKIAIENNQEVGCCSDAAVYMIDWLKHECQLW